MTPPALSDIYTYADDLLTACKTALALTSSGCPSTTYVSPGLPAVDCCSEDSPSGLLVTFATGITLDNTSVPGAPTIEMGHRTVHGRIILVGLAARITRCVPLSDDGALADTTDLSDTALMVDEDLWAIWSYVSAAIRADSLFQGPCKGIYFDTALPVDPQGGCAGWVFPIRVEIPGYTVTP